MLKKTWSAVEYLNQSMKHQNAYLIKAVHTGILLVAPTEQVQLFHTTFNLNIKLCIKPPLCI